MARKVSESNGKHGEPMKYDPDFNGPIKNRSCTDILCLLLFLIFLVAWGVVAVLAAMHGDPEKIFLPTDKQKNVCGKKNFTDRPVLLFFDLTKCAQVTTLIQGCDTEQVCISSCPKQNYIPEMHSETFGQKLSKVRELNEPKPICKYIVDEEQTVETLVKKGDCARYVLKSDDVLGRCVPFVGAIKDAIFQLHNHNDSSKELEDLISKVNTWRDVGGNLLDDLLKYWMIILVGFLAAMLLSLIWIVLMRWIAWIMLWLSIVLVLAVLGVGCWYSFNRYKELDHNQQSDVEFEFTSWKSYDQKNVWMGVGIANSIILLILLLILIFLRNRIRLAIALVEESSKAVGSILSSLFFPIIPFLLQLGVVAFGLFVAANISSATIPTKFTFIPPSCSDICKQYKNLENCDGEDFRKQFNTTCVSNCPDAKCYVTGYEATTIMTWAQVFNLFGMFWALFFVVGFGQMVLAGCFASWYWTFDKRNVPTFVLTNSVCRTLRYHLGSLAFGSLIIAIVKMIRVFLEYVDRKLKEYTDNVVAKCIMCCLKCCFWCLENFIKFINRNAYIMIAVYGKNFCSSARSAFKLLMRNIIRVVVLDKVTDFLLFLGKLTIVGCMGLLSFVFFSGKIEFAKQYANELNYIAVPISIICIGTYAVASCFFNVYSMAVDTLFLCFLEDCEKNDGSNEKPYRMSKNLMKILGKKNVKLVEPGTK